MSQADLRLGLVGAGPWGRNYIATVAALDGVRLARIASANPETASLAGPGCDVTKDRRAVSAADDLDGVIVASPPPSHLEIAESAIEAGHAVLIEKPLSLDAAAANRFLETARAHGAVAMVDHTYLFHPAYRRLKQLCAERGPIRHLTLRAGRWGPFRDDTPVLWDWGAHDLAMVIDLTGAEPDAIEIERTEHRELDEGIGESFSLKVGLGGATADIEFSNIREQRIRKVEAELADGRYVFEDGAEKALTGPQGAIPCNDTPPLTQAVLDFAAAIRAGGPNLESLELGAAVVATLARCQAILDSA